MYLPTLRSWTKVTNERNTVNVVKRTDLLLISAIAQLKGTGFT